MRLVRDGSAPSGKTSTPNSSRPRLKPNSSRPRLKPNSSDAPLPPLTPNIVPKASARIAATGSRRRRNSNIAAISEPICMMSVTAADMRHCSARAAVAAGLLVAR
ncbi:hypothetical protein [Sphingomonas baiyangensis]|uniref:Uncharacterized protein n=1 Tax=Sphingomonas baiyangensis TaxID=2572576 RepID=A0A4U1L863_9SPHN|nr:hypothetical protein [Sphingomonas baiyangensis]TKD53142.1 hypothetical protein FBR43_02055 [Sphingomonas baiyangensis]